MVSRKDNAAWTDKVLLRRRVAATLPDDAQVFELFAGSGLMWRTVWSRFGGVCVDIEADKARVAALDRSRWACYQGDSERLLRAGLGGSVRFAAVDVDCWGAPWKFLQAWFASKRARAPVTMLLLTDGYMARRGLSNADKTLFDRWEGRLNVSCDQYTDQVERKIDEWSAAAGAKGALVWSDGGNGGRMAQHLVEVRTDAR